MRSPSAPAKAASLQAELGLAWARRKVQPTVSAWREEAPGRNRAAREMQDRMRRAGMKLRVSSVRAAKVPKCLYCSFFFPHMASRMLKTRWTSAAAAAPRAPPIKHPAAAQNKVEKTPSIKFSATLSMAARATPRESSRSVSRPTIMETACRASSPFSLRRAEATRAACSASPRGAMQM